MTENPARREGLEGLRRLPAVQALVEEAKGATLHLVGGAVRDALLGRPTYDLDAVVAGEDEAIAARLAQRLAARLVRLGGERFAALRLVAGELVIDLWDRGATSLADDLARRDLTINAMAFDPASGELEDPFGGAGDLERRRLRAVNAQSFAGDPLRVLRLARFAVELPGFQAPSGTVRLARAASAGLAEVASERIRYELARVMAGERAARGMALLAHVGAYPRLWLKGLLLGRAGEVKRASRAPKLLAAFERERARLAALAPEHFSPPNLSSPNVPGLDASAARWALSVLALPEGTPRDALDHLLDAGYLLAATAEDAGRLLEVEVLPEAELDRRRFVHRLGRLWPTAVAVLAAQASLASESAQLERLLRPLLDLARAHGAELIDPPRQLTGDEVRDLLGVTGPGIGQALARLRQAQVDGEVRTKEEAVELLRRPD